ncbi:MAG: hypothetical protein K2W85_17005 [Phycisphaerales bacterium]|nr:hypothetical protein [Phycisphaerales bacterium]
MARSGEHYMPRPDGDFSAWANHYYDAVEKWWSVNGFDESELKPLKDALGAWAAAYPAHVAAQQRAEGARQAKDAARAALEKEVRPVTNFVQGYPKTTNADRAEMGITVRDTSPSPAPAPSSRPLALVESGQRLTHQLRLVDESTPTRRARPKGVQRAEVFVALTPPGQPAPANPGDYRYIGSVTRGETTLSFESDKGGMQAHYLSRWVSTSGATGPWSETASATVAA